MKYKKCNKCSKEFPLTKDFFYKHKTGKDGFGTTCKKCYCLKINKNRKKYLTVDDPNKNKKCIKCGHFYPLTNEFWCKSSYSKNGFKSSCKKCQSKEMKKRLKNFTIKEKNKFYNRGRKIYRDRIKERSCTTCGKKIVEKYNQSKSCGDCWFKSRARQNLKNKNLWKQLKAQFKKQKNKCFYSGRDLILGINCSVDHILPKSKYKDKIDDLDNLKFVDLKVNIAKSDLSEEEFLNLIRTIYEYKLKS